MSLLQKTKFLLRRYRIFPNNFLGQNFLIDSSLFPLMRKYASLGQKDIVVDIGAGLGFLTRFLADHVHKVLAVESDPRLVKVLHEQLQDLLKVKIIEGDILKVNIPYFNKVISITPYQISSQLMLWLFQKKFECAVLMLQKEFTDRLSSQTGHRDYGWLAVLSNYYVEVERLYNVPRWVFHPQPNVDSIIVRLKPKIPPPFTLKNELFFKRFVRSIFTYRNRKVRKALLTLQKNTLPINCSATTRISDLPFLDKRVRELSLENLGVLTNTLTPENN